MSHVTRALRAGCGDTSESVTGHEDREEPCYLDPTCEHPRHDPSSHPCGQRLAEEASTAAFSSCVSAEGVTAPASMPVDQAAPSRPASPPRPYYQDELVTLYNGDCLDVLPSLPPADLIFTSPPYNMGTTTGGGFGHYADGARWNSRGGGGKWTGGALAEGYEDHHDAMPVAEYEEWQRTVLRACWAQLSDVGAIFYNHKPRPQRTLWLPLVVNPDLPLRQIITWVRAGGVNFTQTHYLPTYEWIMVLAKDAWRIKSRGAAGVSDVWRVPQESGTEHPAPFPLGLPSRAIETCAPSLVIDPFSGSGTTLVAAKAAGVRAIGIELSKRYCDMAVARLAQGALNFGESA